MIIPASCITFLPEHAFGVHDKGFSDKSDVRVKFIAGEIKPQARVVLNLREFRHALTALNVFA